MNKRTFRDPKHLENSIKLLKIIIKTLEKHKIKYYLDFGTLIGAMRENTLILWDDDIDISLANEDEYSKIPLVLKEIKEQYGYRTYLHTFESALKKYKKKYPEVITPQIDFTTKENYQIAKVRDNKFWIFGRGYICMDIFFKYNKDDKLHWFAFGKTNKVSNEFLKEGFTQIDFYGISCTIPKAYDAYLTTIYGEWKTPNESWVEDDQISK